MATTIPRTWPTTVPTLTAEHLESIREQYESALGDEDKADSEADAAFYEGARGAYESVLDLLHAAPAPTFTVQVTRSITTEVAVQADTPEAALDIVNKHDFPLPDRDKWDGVKDWAYVVRDAEGDEVLDVSR